MPSQIENTLTTVTSKNLDAARLLITWGHVHECVHIYVSVNSLGMVLHMHAHAHIHEHRTPLPASKAINLVLKNCHYCMALECMLQRVTSPALHTLLHSPLKWAQCNSSSRWPPGQFKLQKPPLHPEYAECILPGFKNHPNIFINNSKSASNTTYHTLPWILCYEVYTLIQKQQHDLITNKVLKHWWEFWRCWSLCRTNKIQRLTVPSCFLTVFMLLAILGHFTYTAFFSRVF